MTDYTGAIVRFWQSVKEELTDVQFYTALLMLQAIMSKDTHINTYHFNQITEYMKEICGKE